MATRIAWVLNLDADLELGAPATYQPSRRVTRAMRAPIERLAASLLGPDDVLLDATAPGSIGRGLPGRAFCPTPGALEILRRAGARPEPHPSADILRRVNSRAFASALGATLKGAAFVTDREIARTMLLAHPPIGDAWRIKHAFGMAGRNQRVVAPSPIDPRDLAFVAAGLALGGVQIEPDVAVEEEYAVHAFLPEDGALRVGPITRQRCDARGAWLATEPIASGQWATRRTPDRMVEECHRVAGALAEAGYFGPFGVDAYTFRDAGGEIRLQPRSEINARYSMGFPRALVPGAGSGA
jgi:hypothetical protein